jgi:hypothetical protein
MVYALKSAKSVDGIILPIVSIVMIVAPSLDMIQKKDLPKKKTKPRSIIKKLDRLFSECIRNIGQCEKCGSRENLQCAHVISRRHYNTRWDLENAICLCVKCHLYWSHKEPHAFVRWFDNKYGGSLYEVLKKRSEKTTKVDYEEKLKKMDYDKLEIEEAEKYYLVPIKDQESLFWIGDKKHLLALEIVMDASKVIATTGVTGESCYILVDMDNKECEETRLKMKEVLRK